MPPKQNEHHDSRDNRKHFHRGEHHLSIPKRVQTVEDRGVLAMIAMKATLDTLYNGNLAAYLKDINLHEHYAKYRHLINDLETYGRPDGLPRVGSTVDDSEQVDNEMISSDQQSSETDE